jgi:hypothetical protein
VLSDDDNQSDFSVLQDLMAGRPATITESNADFLIAAGTSLGNTELVDLALTYLSRPLKVTNVFDRIERKIKLGLDPSGEIGYAACHLVKVDTDLLRGLDLSILAQIFEHEKLQIRNESWLFRFICSLIEEKGDQYRSLLNSVLF